MLKMTLLGLSCRDEVDVEIFERWVAVSVGRFGVMYIGQ